MNTLLDIYVTNNNIIHTDLSSLIIDIGMNLLFKSPLVAYILTSINNLHGLKQLEIYLSIKYNMMYIHDVFTIYVFYIYLVNKLKMIITNIYLYQITCNLCLEFINQNYSTSLLHWIIV